MTEIDEQLARAQRDLMDSFVRRFERLEKTLRWANMPLPTLERRDIQAVDEWVKARKDQQQAESEDPRR